MDLGTPPVTRAYLIAAVGISLAIQCNLVTPYQLYFTYRATFENLQLWRLVTSFLYWGPPSLDFVFHLFFFMRYSRMLEENSFGGRRGDYVWLLVISSSLLLLLSPLSPTPFLSSPLSFTLVYLWSRLNPSVRLSLFGLFNITAPNLPYALIAFTWMVSPNSGWGNVAGDFMGIVVGHWWYFWTEIWKRERGSGGRNWLETPRIFIQIFDGPDRLAERDAQNEAQALAIENLGLPPDPVPIG
ncbi:Der1-like protein [Atractiella rhizophila]|nr:Der1-like protein [Atractiella rhizophila]